jgi:hypothetical protein
LEHIRSFNHWGYDISYEEEKYLTTKNVNFVKILQITNHISKSLLISRHTRIKIYNLLVTSSLHYGSKSWAIRTNGRKLMASVLCEEACGIHSFRPQNKLIMRQPQIL